MRISDWSSDVCSSDLYAASDLLCYRDDRDTALQAQQAAAWNPLLAWAEARHGVEFALARGVLPVDQPPAPATALRDAVRVLDPFRLAPLAPPHWTRVVSGTSGAERLNVGGRRTIKKQK